MSSRIVPRRFFAIADSFPDFPALSFRQNAGWGTWTYRKLASRVDDIAEWLSQSGMRPRDAIGITSVRHPDTIAAMIAILRVGGHYVPLDPQYPEPRLKSLCDITEVKFVLSALPLPETSRFPVAVHEWAGIEFTTADARRASAFDESLTPETAAYVMFTSGSTGEPKGVAIPHRAIVRLVDRPNFMRLDSSRTFLALAPFGFDASTLEIWGPLLNGGHCVLFPPDLLPTVGNLKDVIRDNRVNAMWLTASLFNTIVDRDVRCLTGVDEILTGGEALSVPHVVKAIAALPGTQFINGYGPTENTTFTACYRIPPDFSASEPRVPIGIPVSGTEVIVVDERLRPVPPGGEGELIALGEGLALGYVNQPQFTRERFIDIRRSDGEVVRGYRTGDRAVVNSDGLLDCLGRYDDQVKIDGHRIEPGEIERVIGGIEGIKDCRVLAVTSPTGHKRLVAYLIAENPKQRQDVRERLSGLVPVYMVPHFFIVVDAFPVNSNGKLDRSALPDPFQIVATTAIPVGTPEMTTVADAWHAILGIRVSSADLNFFDAGGTSLEAVRLFELLELRFGRTLEPAFVFAHTTVRRQAEALSEKSSADVANAERGRMRRTAMAGRVGGRR